MARRFDPGALGVSLPKRVGVTFRPFTSYFKGFENVEAVRAIFGDRTARVLRALKVEFVSMRWAYMGVSDEDGHLLVSTHYLRTGEPLHIYLDVVHELVHVKQFRDGRKLFPEGFDYANAPTELEAYRVCIAEGRRLGMTDRELLKYLHVEWLDKKEFARLARNLGIRSAKRRKRRKPR